VYTFELVSSHIPEVSVRNPKVEWNNIGLGYDKSKFSVFQSFEEIMTSRGHSYVDVVKMDIEGGEWNWIFKEGWLLERIGQLLIEIHVINLTNLLYPNKSLKDLIEELEKYNMRMFFKEVNHKYPYCCTEMSFVQKSWGHWDTNKLSFPPLSASKQLLPVSKTMTPEPVSSHRAILHRASSQRTSSHSARLDKLLEGCSDICNTSIVGTQSLFFPFIEKHVDCDGLYNNVAIDEPRPRGPPPIIPEEMRLEFTYGGRIEIENYHRGLLNDQYMGSAASTAVFTEATVNDQIDRCKSGTLGGGYGEGETGSFMSGLNIVAAKIQNGHVLVIGSERPWVEACVLAAGAAQVTTLEYGALISEHPKIKAYTPDVFRQMYFKRILPSFDAVVTFSSVEHSGLGRYGDSLNPWGDLQAIARAWCVTKLGGPLVIAVPGSEFPDKGSSPVNDGKILYNAHRVYGSLMYSHLLSNWKQVWKAPSGLQRVHVLEKVDMLHDNKRNSDVVNHHTGGADSLIIVRVSSHAVKHPNSRHQNQPNKFWVVRDGVRRKIFRRTVHLLGLENQVKTWSLNQLHSIPESPIEFTVDDYHRFKHSFNSDNTSSSVDVKLDFTEYYDRYCALNDNFTLSFFPGKIQGFADRLLGIVSTFTLALVTGRKFAISHDVNYFPSLRAAFEPKRADLFRPDEENWLLKSIERGRFPPDIVSKGTYDVANTHDRLDLLSSTYLFQKLYSNKSVSNLFLISNRGSSSFFEYPHLNKVLRLTNLTPSNIFGNVISYLFRPVSELFEGFDILSNELKDNSTLKIAIQIRTGDRVFGGLPNLHSRNLRENDNYQRFFSCAEQIDRFTKKESKWLLFTDSLELRNSAQQKYGSNKVITTTNFRVEHSADAKMTEASFRKVAAEWWLMGQADYFVISEYSGYGKTAAARTMVDSPKNIYMLDSHEGVTFPADCNENSFASFEKLKSAWSSIRI
jgi:hypothetical protein